MYVADHPGVTASPFAALATAARVTQHLKLGTYVLNSGLRDPIALASDAATLDLISEGRAVLGLGAGHTPSEWAATGRAYPTATERVGRLTETVEVVAALLRGDVVTHRGHFVKVEEGYLLSPRPIQQHLPLLIGGNGQRLLALAGATADIIGFTGLGRTLDDGHRHMADWSERSIEERVAVARNAAAARAPVFDALVQHIEITSRRAEVIEHFATTAPALTPADVLGSPFALIGSLDEIIEELLAHRARWVFTSYVVRADDIDTGAEVLRELITK